MIYTDYPGTGVGPGRRRPRQRYDEASNTDDCGSHTGERAGRRSVCDKGAPALACWGYGCHAPAATRFYPYRLVADNRFDESADIGTAASGSANGARRWTGDVLEAPPGLHTSDTQPRTAPLQPPRASPPRPSAGAGGLLGADHFPLLHPSGRMRCSIESQGRGEHNGSRR